jgi:hypothetical protein
VGEPLKVRAPRIANAVYNAVCHPFPQNADHADDVLKACVNSSKKD